MPFYLAATSSTITSIAWRSLYTDHRPLDSITKKPQATAPPRLQRVQKYNLKIIMSWEKASQLPTLSPGGTSQQSLKVTSVKTSRSSSMLSLGTYQSATRRCSSCYWPPQQTHSCNPRSPQSNMAGQRCNKIASQASPSSGTSWTHCLSPMTSSSKES